MVIFADIVDLTNLSGDQKRQLKDMAAAMQPPAVSRHEDYRSSVDDRRAGPSRPPPAPRDANRFRSRQFVPQHSATRSPIQWVRRIHRWFLEATRFVL